MQTCILLFLVFLFFLILNIDIMSDGEDQSTKQQQKNLDTPVGGETQQDRNRRLNSRRKRGYRGNSQSEGGDSEGWEMGTIPGLANQG